MHDKIVLIQKDKLSTIEVLISKVLIDTYTSRICLVNNVLKEYNEIKEEIQNPKTSVEYTIYKQWKPLVSVVGKILQKKIRVFEKLNKTDQCFYQVVLFVARRNRLLLKIKNFQMINLK